MLTATRTDSDGCEQPAATLEANVDDTQHPVTVPKRAERIASLAQWIADGNRPSATWRARAACKGLGAPDLFFPEPGGKTANEVAVARQMCFACPVRYDCGTVGLFQQYGVWGGITNRERRRVTASLPPDTVQALRDRYSPPPVMEAVAMMDVFLRHRETKADGQPDPVEVPV